MFILTLMSAVINFMDLFLTFLLLILGRDKPLHYVLLLTLFTHIIMCLIQTVFVIYHLTFADPTTPSINKILKYADL
jgi:hypothetical protein